ncbi:MAG: hypothetical protein LAO24_15665 [Acidobacteriia bacterium]|nr:hypothetical protein [Terriglobia bacterium]
MKTNQPMDVLYDEIRQENLDDPKALPQKLLTMLNGGFTEQDQCVFLALLRKEAPVSRLDFPDCTAYECFVNHIHIEDYLENGGLPPLEMVGRGIALARELKARLSGLHGGKHFRIIVAFDGLTCTVRFHTVRLDEEWIDKNVNGHRGEAVAVLETQELEP